MPELLVTAMPRPPWRALEGGVVYVVDRLMLVLLEGNGLKST